MLNAFTRAYMHDWLANGKQTHVRVGPLRYAIVSTQKIERCPPQSSPGVDLLGDITNLRLVLR